MIITEKVELGKQVLLLILLAKWHCREKGYETLVEDLNIFNVIQTKEYSARRKWKNKFKKIGLKIDVVLGSSDMDYYGPDENGIVILKKKLDLLDGFYDYIFIDFPPAHNLVTMMYLVFRCIWQKAQASMAILM